MKLSQPTQPIEPNVLSTSPKTKKKFTGGPINFNGNASSATNTETPVGQDIVHLRIKVRTGRKRITHIQGIAASIDQKKLAKIIAKKLHCSSRTIDHEKYGKCITVSGDNRDALIEIMIAQKVILDEKYVRIHG